ncbi:dihydrodipicolinate synthase family protein [Termitidicoccus mucosus]|uniref:Dihydrodipicolinate synthase family protein n=1 Tax=Termitidicoccus mucosus TaxID=1184151 RepID=A0A178IMT0_9BACT|nr:dihydrodipicolinate synthase family protein [Opitutaceae bacterium TSB47]
MHSIPSIRNHLLAGQVIPALPLALDRRRRWSELRQRAVLRYYLDAGAGGVAVGVHSTQFEIREKKHGLFGPLLAFAAETITSWLDSRPRPFLRIAGVCGRTSQAVTEAEIAAGLGYHAALLSVAAFKNENERVIIRHCERVARTIPVIGFYLQTAVGGRMLSYRFWRAFADIPNVVAVKMAPFNRYQTHDVIRAVIDSGREDIALYTGNDDNIIVDLLTPFAHAGKTRYVVGGLLGQWGVWTERATDILAGIKKARNRQKISADWLARAAALTDANGAIFDVANGFAGCIPGIHEILRRQGIFETTACLNPHEKLSPGQAAELDRVIRAYPWLTDDTFVQENRHRWLK